LERRQILLNMKKYTNYKDSGIEWIGEIPSHWELKRLKFFAKICNGQDHKEVSDENGKFPVFGSGGQFGTANQFLYDKPSVLLGRKGTIDKPRYIDFPFWTVDTAYYTKILPNNNPKFFYYLCTTINFDLYKYGSAIPSMTQGTLNDIVFCSPDESEQTAIANFLDHKTAQIDDLIAQKEQLISLLEEERTAIINELVTGKKVWNGKEWTKPEKTKNSGIEWLGEIPEEWEVKRMRYLCDIGTGSKDTENREDDGEYPFYVRSQIVERISTYSFDGEAILTAGDGVGVCKVWHYVNGKFDYHQRVYRMSDFKDIEGKFLFYYLKDNFIKEVMKLSAKSTVDSLRRPMFQNFMIAFPVINAQNIIIQHINEENDRIDNLVLIYNQEIDLLKEYKTALISEVVTGKVDVSTSSIQD
jgi:type I restriction enzyme, S subunit